MLRNSHYVSQLNKLKLHTGQAHAACFDCFDPAFRSNRFDPAFPAFPAFSRFSFTSHFSRRNQRSTHEMHIFVRVLATLNTFLPLRTVGQAATTSNDQMPTTSNSHVFDYEQRVMSTKVRARRQRGQQLIRRSASGATSNSTSEDDDFNDGADNYNYNYN